MEVFEDLLDDPLLKVFDAAVPAFEEVTFLGAFVCERALPAADFAVLLAPLLFRTFEAADAALLLVTSLLATGIFLDLIT